MEFIETFISLPVIIILLYYMIKYLISKIHEYNLVKYFSGHKAYPLIGNIHVLLSEPKDITNTILKEMENYPLPWRIWSGTKLCIISDDPEHIDIISKHSSSFEKSFQYNFVKPYIGNGLIAASASIWESHRQMLNPIFKVNIFSNQMSKIIKHSNRLTRIIENLNEKEIDVHHYIHLFTLDTIYDTILGRDFNFQNNPKCRLHNDISELLNITTKRVYKFWLHPDIIFYNLPIGKRFREALSHLDTLTWKIIKERKESMQEKKINGEMKEKDATNNTSLFLDTIFKSFYERKEYTEHDIRDEINTIVITGSDTTAFSITFVLLMLAIYPKIQEQVYEELNQIYGSFDPIDKNLSYEDTKNMKCLERVIKETLRLFPAAPFMARNICEDIQVSEDVIIPKNSAYMFMLYSLHRNEKYWKNPLQFNPDRFLPGNYNTKHFLPFSTGPRGCIGWKFAMMEMEAAIATILRKFSVHVDGPIKCEDIAIQLGVSMKPVNKILLKFKKR